MTTNEYLMKATSTSSRFWLFWVLAFLGFPIAGLLANIAGSVTTPARALLAGAIAGATFGLIQWLILRTRLPLLPIWWVVASSAGMALGLAISTVVLGSETAGSELLWRGAITGFCLGLAQFIVFRKFLPLPQLVICVGAQFLFTHSTWTEMTTIGLLPIALWEFSLGFWLAAKGYKPSAITSKYVNMETNALLSAA
jgi:hypothetical protein